MFLGVGACAKAATITWNVAGGSTWDTLKLETSIPGLYECLVSNTSAWDTTTAIPHGGSDVGFVVTPIDGSDYNNVTATIAAPDLGGKLFGRLMATDN